MLKREKEKIGCRVEVKAEAKVRIGGALRKTALKREVHGKEDTCWLELNSKGGRDSKEGDLPDD